MEKERARGGEGSTLRTPRCQLSTIMTRNSQKLIAVPSGSQGVLQSSLGSNFLVVPLEGTLPRIENMDWMQYLQVVVKYLDYDNSNEYVCRVEIFIRERFYYRPVIFPSHTENLTTLRLHYEEIIGCNELINFIDITKKANTQNPALTTRSIYAY